MAPDARFDRINRLAVLLLATSGCVGLACIALAAWLWPLEWAVAAGIGCVSLVWGFLGALSWLSAASAARVEQAIATADLHRRIRAGTAEPERGSMSLARLGDGGELSLEGRPTAPIGVRPTDPAARRT